MHVYVCVSICVYACVYACVCICVYSCMCMYMYAYVYVCVCVSNVYSACSMCVRTKWHMRSQWIASWNSFSASIVWVSGKELKSSVWLLFTHRAISLSSLCVFETGLLYSVQPSIVRVPQLLKEDSYSKSKNVYSAEITSIQGSPIHQNGNHWRNLPVPFYDGLRKFSRS